MFKSDSGFSGILVGLLYFVLGIVFIAATDELIMIATATIERWKLVKVSWCLVQNGSEKPMQLLIV